MRLLELFHEITLRPQSSKELKALILQLAVDGELSKKWRERNNLNFDWQKEFLENLVSVFRGITFPKSEKSKTYSIGKIACLRTSNVQDLIEWTDLLFIDESFVKNIGQYIREGDVVMSMANSKELVGKVALIEKVEHDKCTFGGFLAVLRSKIFISKYLLYLLRSPELKSRLISSSSQTTNIANISVGRLNKIELFAPPLEEQKAIVAIVESLFQEIEQLEQLTKARVEQGEDFVTAALRELTAGDTPQAWSTLQPHFQRFFKTEQSIKKLRESILQLAVQGKLTANWRAANPNVEPASELLKRIQAEKAQLIKEKKIKKEDPLPPIKEDQKPFKLPEGWEWCRFQEIFDIRDGTHDSPKDSTDKITYPLVTSKNFKDGQIDFDSARRISEDDYLKVIQRSKVNTGDILFSMIGGNIGNQVEVGEFTEFAIKNVALFKHYNYGIPAPGFLKMFSQYISMNLQKEAAGGAQPFVSLKVFRNIVIGLPSYKEQKVIVEKVNELMAFCDELEAQIKQNQTYAEQLMQSVVREVVAS